MSCRRRTGSIPRSVTRTLLRSQPLPGLHRRAGVDDGVDDEVERQLKELDD